jgi:hypothetical protein
MKTRSFWILLLLLAIGFFTAHDIVLSTQTSQHTSLHAQELTSADEHTDTCEFHTLFHTSFILPATHAAFPNLENFIIAVHTYQCPKNHSPTPVYRPPITA